ncbi:MAG: hypothetical protein F4Y02_08895 [Chloroflexi bacterium]|nr:hypothetical protein [Chloroflexota bacterium]
MADSDSLINDLEHLPPKEIVEILSSEKRPTVSISISMENEIRPVDLFCYLFARFGAPNGLLSFLRGDHSDNLVHWNWTLRCPGGLMDIQGANYHTNIYLIGDFDVDDFHKEALIGSIKRDLKNYGALMARCRKSLEHWVEFVNPYHRVHQTVNVLLDELKSLRIGELSEVPRILSITDPAQRQIAITQWNDAGRRFHQAFGICFGIRSMLPIMGEAFVNLLLYVLMRREQRMDDRLRAYRFREPFDIRVKGLSQNCHGFATSIDYSHPACGKYHSLVNERNNLLHGNVAIDKLQFNELFFWGKVPIFREYQSMWHRAFETQRTTVGLDEVEQEVAVVTDFVDYILSCLTDPVRAKIEFAISKKQLGLHKTEHRVGVLFSDHMIDSSIM